MSYERIAKNCRGAIDRDDDADVVPAKTVVLTVPSHSLSDVLIPKKSVSFLKKMQVLRKQSKK